MAIVICCTISVARTAYLHTSTTRDGVNSGNNAASEVAVARANSCVHDVDVDTLASLSRLGESDLVEIPLVRNLLALCRRDIGNNEHGQVWLDELYLVRVLCEHLLQASFCGRHGHETHTLLSWVTYCLALTEPGISTTELHQLLVTCFLIEDNDPIELVISALFLVLQMQHAEGTCSHAILQILILQVTQFVVVHGYTCNHS